jgi:hypothetical protein
LFQVNGHVGDKAALELGHDSVFVDHELVLLRLLFSFESKYEPTFRVVPVDCPVLPGLGLLAILVISAELFLIDFG